MGKRSKEINRLFVKKMFLFVSLNFSVVIKGLNLQDHQAKIHNYRKGLTYLKNRAPTNQNQTLHVQKMKKKIKQKIIRGHPTKERREE